MYMLYKTLQTIKFQTYIFQRKHILQKKKYFQWFEKSRIFSASPYCINLPDSYKHGSCYKVSVGGSLLVLFPHISYTLYTFYHPSLYCV